MSYELFVKAAWKSDPEFVALCKTLYGPDATAETVIKMEPCAPDMAPMGPTLPKKKKQKVVKRGGEIPRRPREFRRDDHGRFASGVSVAADAATAGLFGSASLVAGTKTSQNAKDIVGMVGRLRQTSSGRKALLRAIGSTGGKTALLAAAGGIAGAAAAHHGKQAFEELKAQQALERAHRRDVRGTTRQLDFEEFVGDDPRSTTVVTHGDARDAVTHIVRKSAVDMAGQITGIDEDRHQVFGWASIVQKDGHPVVDLQGDYIGVEELEKAAYDYVQKSRVGGAMHYRVDDDGNVIAKSKPYHAADLIESFVVTPEKIEKMGLPDSTPLGWWVGFKVNDPDVWSVVKSGEWKGFSIHGSGRRTAKSIDELEINSAELNR